MRGIFRRWKTAHQVGDDPIQVAIKKAVADADPQQVKLIVVTYGSDHSARRAIEKAKESQAALIVCFLRDVVLSYKYGGGACFTINTDAAAQKTFARFMDVGAELQVPVIPVYKAGHHTAEMLADLAVKSHAKMILLDALAPGRLRSLRRRRGRARLKAILPDDVRIEILSV